MSDLAREVYDIAERRDRRFKHRWVLSAKHVQAFRDEENERREGERQRLAALLAQFPALDLAESLRWNQPLPPPDYTKVDEMRLLGWPVRIADVDEITLEPVDRKHGVLYELDWDET